MEYSEHVLGSQMVKEFREWLAFLDSDTYNRVMAAAEILGEEGPLAGGDKTNEWDAWHKKNIPLADTRFARHLKARDEDDKERSR